MSQTKTRIGALTVGQSPRTDVTPDIMPLLGDDFELMQAGALDNVEDFDAISPDPGDYVLVSRLRDGSSVRFAERKIMPNAHRAAQRLESAGASSIMVWCTGEFPEPLSVGIPVLYPSRILANTVAAIAPRRLAVVIPDQSQIDQARSQWLRVVDQVLVVPACPYDSPPALDKALGHAAEAALRFDADLAVLDCIGYSAQMKRRFRETSGIPTILPRTLLTRIVQELA